MKLIALGVNVSLLVGVATGGQDRERHHELAGRAPVVVELFTSEGCSDCPLADRLLEKLGKEQSLEGTEVIVLSEHVDYWNYLGWRDPFSSSLFSERQAGYVRAFHLQGAYTPQMVVDGLSEFVGSDQEKATEAIANAAERHKAIVELRAVDESPGHLRLHYHITHAPLDCLVWLAITEDNLLSNVSRGENSGRRLAHTGVVRDLKQIGSVSHGQDSDADVTVSLNSEWRRENLRAVLFLQLPKQGRIVGSAVIPLRHE